jgi:hypothetical protein
MKNILLLFGASIFSMATFAQTTFTNTNEPSIGETRTLYLCDSNAVDLANITGNGVTWNYSQTDTYAGQTRLLSIVTPSATGYAADFPGATKTAVIQGYISTFMSSTATERISQGYLIESVDLGIVKAKFSNDQENLMTYPFALNGTVNDIFSGNLSFTYNSIPQNPSCTGNSVSKYDGFGTLLQVNNISVPNVSRFHIVDTTFTTIPIIGNSKVIRSQYEYYDLAASNKTPIFIHSHVKIESGFPEPLVDISVVLSAVSGNGVASINENNKNNISIYPNPAKSNFTISGISPDAQVTLIDLGGRSTNLTRSNSNEFNVSDFATGVYMLQILNKGEIFTKRLILE